MATHISHSPQETERLGESLAKTIAPGSVVGLDGDLGAGKTQFVRGFARGLGVTGRVQSPTFALINIYDSGSLPLYHIDLYRLESSEQIVAAGLAEYFEPRGIAIVEWYERWKGAEPSRLIRVRMESTGETDRRISIHDHAGA